MNTQHTPATWYQRPTGSDQNAVASENTGETIAVVYHDNEANAQLIAAAPELLEALDKLLRCTELNMDDMEAETRQAIEQAEQAISKATT